jgi:TetR/AcrR family transcriptional repressor of bet genes
MAGRRAGAVAADQAAARRQEILAATLAVIARKGLSGLTLNDIAVEVGCSYGLVSFHFKSKERLLLMALDTLVEEYEPMWLALGAGPLPPPAVRLALMIKADFDRRVASSGKVAIWTAFWAEASRAPAYRKKCAELKRRYQAKAVDLVREIAIAHGVTLDAEQVAGGLNAMIDGAWLQGHVTGDWGDAGRARARDTCLAYLAAVLPAAFGPGSEALAVFNPPRPKQAKQQ